MTSGCLSSSLNRTLKKDESISLANGEKVIVLDSKPIGRGGQGEVYRVLYKEEIYALKWIVNEEFFKKDNSDAFYNNIKRLCENEAVREGRLKDFAMPLILTEVSNGGQFGYLMKLIPKKMTPLVKILSGSCGFTKFDILLKACKNIASEFALLHTYRTFFTDLNDGSIFIDTDTGDVMICDCDNITFEGQINKTVGKIGFMAPEVFTNHDCSCESDRYSLSILLYLLLFGDDPFDGSLWQGLIMDKETNIEKYIRRPIFTMGPDDSNRPSADVIEKWNNTIPPDIKDNFTRTFTDGIFDKKNRVSANEWKGSFDTWLSTIISDPFRTFAMRPLPKKIQIVIFIVDSSMSMSGTKMEEVNSAIIKTVSELKEVKEEQPQIEFKIGIMQFSDNASWYGGGSILDIDDINHIQLEPTGDLTQFDEACMVLDESLSKDGGIFDFDKKYKRPFLLLISDGGFPEKLYRDYIHELRSNHIFRKSHKFAIGVKDEYSQPSVQMLNDFTDDETMVATVDEIKGMLGQLIYNMTMAFSTSIDDEVDHEKITLIKSEIRGN